MIPFVKLHGIGNDFVLIDLREVAYHDWQRLASRICDRRFGVGADGLLLVSVESDGVFRMEMLNPDGSPGGMCGNGVRCVARYLLDQGLDLDSLWVGQRQLAISHLDGLFSVEMGPTELRSSAVVQGFKGQNVWVGNPHFVVAVPDLDGVDLAQVGPLMECDPQFPDRSNIHFFQCVSAAHVRAKTWERGAGVTLACGSGACAIAAAARLAGLCTNECAVDLPGGSLLIRLSHQGDATMLGPAVESFRGAWED